MRCPKLTSVVISKGLKDWDEGLDKSAMRLFRTNKGLRKAVLSQGHPPRSVTGNLILTQHCTYEVIHSPYEAGRALVVVDKSSAKGMRRYRRALPA